jgi:two-component system CheB/CheR fusion protein
MSHKITCKILGLNDNLHGTLKLLVTEETVRAFHPDFIVGIGGSAGSLCAIKALFEALPIDTGAAFIVVTHLKPNSSSLLDLIIARHTQMAVIVASTGMRVKANCVYVIPPNADLSIDGYTLNIVSPPHRISRQVDCFFTSLAESKGTHAVGIILSGYCHDGTEGCRHIKARGGMIFAQDTSAEVSSMPLSAQASGCVNSVLPPDKMPVELLKLFQPFHENSYHYDSLGRFVSVWANDR